MIKARFSTPWDAAAETAKAASEAYVSKKTLEAETAKAAIEAYVSKKTLHKEAFREYIRLSDPALPIFLAALQRVVDEQGRLAEEVLDIIRQAIYLLREHLPADARPEERAEVRRLVIELVDKAREEMERNRAFMWKLLTFGGAVVVGTFAAVVGGLVYARSPSLGRRPLAKSTPLLRRLPLSLG
jgi:hypothetical protein